MKRRSILGAAALVTGSLAAPAIAQSKRELKMVTCWPKNFPGVGTGAARIAKRITEASEGKLTVKLYSAGELVPAFESFDAVSSGVADMYHGAEYYWQGKSKGFIFFADIPAGMTAYERNAWIHHGGGQELWDELAAPFNVKSLPCGSTGVQMGGWYKKEIESIDDFKGLKIRMPGAGGEMLRKLGAVVVNLPPAELFPALQSGTIDAVDWNSPWNDQAFAFYKIAPYYYGPGMQEPGTSLALGLNKKVWDDLTDGERQLITSVALAENDFTFAEYYAHNARAMEELAKKDVNIRLFSDDILKTLAKTAREVTQEIGESGDPITQKIHQSFTDFQARVTPWTNVSEQAYIRARSL